MTILEVAKRYKETLQDGVSWIVLYKSGRSWEAEIVHPDYDRHENRMTADRFDALEMLKALDTDCNAVVLNAYYANLGDITANSVQTLSRYLQWQYEHSVFCIRDLW